MSPISRQLMEGIIEYILISSTNESEAYIKDATKVFRDEEHTDAELYDYICSIGDMRVDRITTVDGDKICIGYISGFTQKLCELKLYYSRPDDGVTTPKPVGGWKSFMES